MKTVKDVNNIKLKKQNINKDKSLYKEEDKYKTYKLLCDLYDTSPCIKINWSYLITKFTPKIKKLINDAKLNVEELKVLDDYLSERIIRDSNINLILNKIKKDDNLINLKEPEMTFTSFTNKHVYLYVDFIGGSISDKECSSYINEIYRVFDDIDFIKVDINSSKDKIKFFLQQVTKYVIINGKNNNEYNEHHIGFIHSYFIQKGWTNIYKTMEIFLRKHYFNADITYWYIKQNLKRKNRDTIDYKILFNDDYLFDYKQEYKKDLMIRLKLAKRYDKSKINDVLLAERDFYLTYNDIND